MTDQELLARISVNPKIAAGKPVIKGTRLSVEFILKLVKNGMRVDEIVAEYPRLGRRDIAACVRYDADS